MAENTWWQPPQLRTDEEEGRERRVTWLELFYDLAFAVVIAELAHYLAAHVSSEGAFGYVLLFIPAWWLWVGGTIYNDRFESEDISHRFATFAQMIPVAALAIFAHDGLGKLGEEFALSYAVGRLLLLVLWLRGGWHNPDFRPVAHRYAIGFSVAIGFWIAAAFVEPPWRYGFWAIAITIDLLTPLWTLKHQEKLPKLSSSHLPERFGLFTIIVLGEAVAGVVRGLAVLPEINFRAALTGLFGMALAFGLWWIYFDFVARRLLKPDVEWRWFNLYTHLPLVMGIAAVGAGIQAVIASEADGLTGGERWLISGAIGLTLATIGFIELTLPSEDAEDPSNHYLSAPMKIGLGILAPIACGGWHDFLGTYALLGTLLFFLLIPMIYVVLIWYQAPEHEREKHGYRYEGTADDTQTSAPDFK